MIESKGKAFRRLLKDEPYVFTGGVYSPLDAQIAEKVGIKAIYLSGYSVAMANGWPDMGFLTQTEVARIASMVAGAPRAPPLPPPPPPHRPPPPAPSPPHPHVQTH